MMERGIRHAQTDIKRELWEVLILFVVVGGGVIG